MATMSNCLLSSIAPESYERLSCGRVLRLVQASCCESYKRLNRLHALEPSHKHHHLRPSCRSYECVRMLLDARANVNQQVKFVSMVLPRLNPCIQQQLSLFMKFFYKCCCESKWWWWMINLAGFLWLHPASHCRTQWVQVEYKNSQIQTHANEIHNY